MKSLHSWWTYQREGGQSFSEVLPTRALAHKLKPAIYLWQHNERHLSHQNVNACMRFMLHGLMLRTVDGHEISQTSHLFRHSFATALRAIKTPIDVIALLMTQRDTKVTDFSFKQTPTPTTKIQ